MAIKLVDEYPTKTVAADADYPGGSFKNATSDVAADGTPLEKKWANDWLGFFSALLASAGITPSGAPDTAAASQYLQALQALFAAKTHEALTNPHSATAVATPNRIAMWNAAGKLAGDILGNAATALAALTGYTFVANKNGQASYNTGAFEARSETGDVIIGWHASGATATYLKHARNGNGLSLHDSVGNLAPFTALTFAGGLFPANVLAAIAAGTFGAAGTRALLFDTGVRATTPGQARAGSELRYANVLANTADVGYGPYAPAGTWVCCGHTGVVDGGTPTTEPVSRTTEWLRIS